jgi:hypothetical protein
MTTIFEEVKEKGIQYDNWQSDLYIPVTEETKKIVKNYPNLCPMVFIDQIEKKQWYDLPFAYDPFWNRNRGL